MKHQEKLHCEPLKLFRVMQKCFEIKKRHQNAITTTTTKRREQNKKHLAYADML